MLRITSLLVLASLLAISSPAADAPNLDIAGIKVGMLAKDALAAMKVASPAGNITIGNHQLQGFDKPVHPNAISETVSSDNDGEHIEVLFTLPPTHAYAWAITRTHGYLEKNRPSLDNTLAALRAKYGPESIPADPDPRNITKNMVWVFDAQGKLLSEADAKPLYRSCRLANHFGTDDMPSLNDIQTGAAANDSANNIILITASVQATARNEVYNLTVQMVDGPRYVKAIEATRAVVTGADKAAKDKADDELNKRGAPKL